jgi:hypothetical protein
LKTDLLNKIKSRGYWRINFQPRKLIPEKLTHSNCREVVQKSQVRLRGWDYPFFPNKNDDEQGSAPSGEFFEAWIDWWNHIEYWRMYRSHQFIHYLALREDWLEKSDWSRALAQQISPGQVIGTGGTIWQMTEVFEFLSRLGRAEFYPSGAVVSISLENTSDRQLWVDDPQRMPFFTAKKTGASRIEITREVDPSDFISQGVDIARSTILEFFDHFGWDQVSDANIRADQERFLAGKL